MSSRREFLAASGALALTAAAERHRPAPPAQARAALDVTEKQIAGTARLIPGCCAYSYNGYLRRGEMTLEDFIRMAVKLELPAVDMTAYYFRSTEPAYLASLRHLAYRCGVAFSGAASGVSLVQADPARRQAAQTTLAQWIEVADRLGAPHLRVFGGKLPAGHRLEEAIGWVVEGLKPACARAGERGIMLGIEDHAGITQTADVCLQILERVGSPWLGINLDITHFLPAAGQDAYAQIAACIPHATNTHIRAQFDDRTPIDMDRVWRMFARAGFKGYMSVEYEPQLAGGEDAITGVPKLVAEVEKLCRRYSSV